MYALCLLDSTRRDGFLLGLVEKKSKKKGFPKEIGLAVTVYSVHLSYFFCMKVKWPTSFLGKVLCTRHQGGLIATRYVVWAAFKSFGDYIPNLVFF